MRPLSQEKQGQGLKQQGRRFLLCLSGSCRFAVSKHCCFSLKRVPLSHKHREDRSWAGSARGTISLSLSPSGITFVTIHCRNEWRPCSRLY